LRKVHGPHLSSLGDRGRAPSVNIATGHSAPERLLEMVRSACAAGTTTPTGASMPQTGGLLTGCLPADFTVRPGTFSTSTGVTAFLYSLAPGAGIASPGPTRARSQRANCLRERDGKITYTAS